MSLKKIIPIILLIISIPAIYYLLIPGFYEPHDLHHFADIYEMARAISSGQFPPRLGPDFSFNYGYPLFNFYYVMPFYLSSLIYFLFGSVITAFKGIFIFTVLLSVLGMYFFLRQFLEKWASFVGSIVFLYTPYRAVQIYVRGAMGEAFALSLIPWVLFFIVKVIKEPKKLKYIALAALVTAVFILSHNYLWALTFPWFILFVFLLFDFKVIKKSLISLVTFGLLSLGTSAYWWLPALVEQKLVASTTPFPLIDHFPFIKQLIIPSWGYGSSVWGPGDGLSFQIGVVNLSVFLSIIVILLLKRRWLSENRLVRITLWGMAGFLLSFAMMNVRTYPLWKLVPFHDLIQFPWRLLIFTTFFSAIFAAVVTQIFIKKKVVGVLIILGSVILTFTYFRPSKVFNKTDNDYLALFFADRTLIGTKNSLSDEYKNYSEDYLLLPKWTTKRPGNLPKSKIQIDYGTVKTIEEISSVKWKAEISTTRDSKVTFNSYYFPGWFANIDGRPAVITIGKPYGQIELSLVSGNHIIDFYWKETSLRKVADYISIFSLFVTLLFLLKNINLRRKI